MPANEPKTPKPDVCDAWAAGLIDFINVLHNPAAGITPIPDGNPQSQLDAIHRLFTMLRYEASDALQPQAAWGKRIADSVQGSIASFANDLTQFISSLENRLVELAKSGVQNVRRQIIAPELLPNNAIVKLADKWALRDLNTGNLIPLMALVVNRLDNSHLLRTVLPPEQLFDGTMLVLGPGVDLYLTTGRFLEPRKFYWLDVAIGRTKEYRAIQDMEVQRENEMEFRRKTQERAVYLSTPHGQIAELRRELDEERTKRQELEARFEKEKA